ncbi:MFS transporter [Dyella sp. 20L07]|uniref:MFS transporter n=1 Tax=Dyella sp. 20L07 TaxID=3384240 RepID=UPI003D28F427
MISPTSHDAGRGKSFILAAICLAAIVLPLSFSGGAVATPAISRDLGGSPAALTWITNAFLLSFGSLLMAAGALADQFGRKRLFSVGLGLFVASSLALNVAPTVLWLDVLRAVQGIAAAAALAGGSAALAQEFEGHARTRAFGMLGASFGLGLAFGPVLAGLLIASFGWRSIFMLIAATGGVALMFGVPRMRESRDPDAAGLDWLGAVTFTATLVLLTFGIIQGPESGWTSGLIQVLFAGAALLLCIFVMIELRVARPMLDLSLFRYPRFVGVQVLPIGTCYCYIVLVVLLPLRLIGIEGFSEMRAGLLMLALSSPMLVMPLLAARLTRWVSAGVLSGIGFLLAATGLYWLSRVGFAGPMTALARPMLLIGIGTGLPWGLMDGLSVSVVPKERAGMATGIFSTTRVAGEGIALAVVGALLAGLMQAGLHHALPMVESGQVASAAQRLAAGDLVHASVALPQASIAVMKASYAEAFHSVLRLLAMITAACALVVLCVLGRTKNAAADLDASPSAVGDNEAAWEGANL